MSEIDDEKITDELARKRWIVQSRIKVLESEKLALEETNRRLREALEKIEKMDTCDADYDDGGPCLGACPKSIAKEALHPKGEK